jgi:hypothetical protein
LRQEKVKGAITWQQPTGRQALHNEAKAFVQLLPGSRTMPEVVCLSCGATGKLPGCLAGP